jgi:hypothetical protein
MVEQAYTKALKAETYIKSLNDEINDLKDYKSSSAMQISEV